MPKVKWILSPFSPALSVISGYFEAIFAMRTQTFGWQGWILIYKEKKNTECLIGLTHFHFTAPFFMQYISVFLICMIYLEVTSWFREKWGVSFFWERERNIVVKKVPLWFKTQDRQLWSAEKAAKYAPFPKQPHFAEEKELVKVIGKPWSIRFTTVDSEKKKLCRP